ncbi:class I adenylate-forming enzyme family protein [Polyangium aurulentum]|uniref:class I adenylate-forming enzyme family protein n=1 Tax=Polyangium aurulentum TaxID=2567896 RepID=UPI0010AE74A5|nr:AMP-binding protein [Polyangium aurulentum]UQA57371.1 AMP-binding protein [Polyangium aurulentum]
MDGLSLLEAASDPHVAPSPALIVDGAAISFAALADRVRRVLRHLSSLGIGPGARVALRATCEPSTVVALHALLELGAALVPLHPRLTEKEAALILADAAPHHILSAEDLDPPDKPGPIPHIPADPDAPLAIIYTSGTTGRPKGAVLSRGAFAASAVASEKNLSWREDDRWLVCMPLAHVGGLSILTRCLIARRPIVLVPRFDPISVLRAIERDHATILSAVPTMLRALFDADREGILSRLRLVLLGGAGAPASLLEEAAARRVLALTTYGLTEACSQVTCQKLRPAGSTEPGSGHVLPGFELRIVNEAGQGTATDEVGGIQIRGPNLMRGYLANPAAPFTDDGWFNTGDLGSLDAEGRLFVHARRTDLIVTGGENVYPAEVEAALEALLDVDRAVVFGIPDERWGQLVAAGLTLAEGTSGGPARALDLVLEACRNLAPHKRPRLFAAVPSLPMTASGKLDRATARREITPLLRPVPARPA